MSELPLVSPGEVIASDHINDIMLRTFQRYASIADRNAETPTPQAGELAYMAAEGTSLVRLAFFDGVNWIEVTSVGARVLAAFGTVPLPGISFLNDPDLGFARTGPNEMSASNGASVSVIFRSDTNISGPAGGAMLIRPNVSASPLSPTYSFLDGLDSGMYHSAAGEISFSSTNVDVFRATAARVRMPPIYDDTTAAAADVVVEADGRMRRSTSARRYKSNIQAAPQLADLDLEPVTFHHDADDKDYIGFIADDVPIEEAMTRNDAGEAENYDLRAVVAILAAKCNALTARVEALEA